MAAGRPLLSDHVRVFGRGFRRARPAGRVTSTRVWALVALAGLAAAACTPSSATDLHATDAGVTTSTMAAIGAAPAPNSVGGDNRTAPSTTTTTAAPKPMDDGQLTVGESGAEVGLLQLRLTELGYRPGTPDGTYGGATASAVMAFQKHEGLGRDGTAGPEVLDRLKAPQGFGPSDTAGGPRIEVDLDRQIAFIIPGDGSVSTINVSTGSGETYAVPDSDQTAVAYTPTGSYRVGLRIDGPEHGKLGTLYRPLYFTGGWAVHGSTSVPGYPASHGCVRTSYTDQDWLFDQFPTGSSVVIYRGAADSTGPPPANAAAGD